MSLLHFLSYGAAVAAFLFVTLAIASGLLWISELIEEHSKLAKSVGTRGIYLIIGLHLALCYTDALPLWRTLFSVACHVVYLQNFSAAWPTISLLSPAFLASCALVVADHFVWFFYFAAKAADARHAPRQRLLTVNSAKAPSFGDMATFFGICVWLAPLFLFLSLSANDNALPTGIPSTPSRASFNTTPPTPRTSLFRALVEPLAYFSRARSGRAQKEGLIAPRSPGPSRPTSPLGLASPAFAFQSAQGPGSPPTPRAASFEYERHLTPDFIQRAPPPRRATASAEEFGVSVLKRR